MSTNWLNFRDKPQISLKPNQLQAMFVRRREMEHMRVERTAALDRYYDRWGKVTKRFENWTAPEYYKQADEKLKSIKDKKEKERQLTERRQKLRTIFQAETKALEEEQRAKDKPRSRQNPVTADILEKIDSAAKQRENLKRKLDMEAKLYGRWRHGVDDENLIFESKSDNQVLAKLNWLDKQIEEQLVREQEEAKAQERNLQLQREISKTEQTQKERQEIREKEIREIRALQERHMSELKERQRESDMLKDEEKHMRKCLAELEKELNLLEESSAVLLEAAELSQAYNLKNIKVFIRKRSDMFRNQIQLSIDMLGRMRAYASKPNEIASLLEKCRDQLEAETFTLSQIEAMYESEAKYNLLRCEEVWQAQHMERYNALKQLLKDERCVLSMQIDENMQRQADIIEIRGTHLVSIENSNEKLNQLMQEQESSPRGAAAVSEDAAAKHVVPPLSLPLQKALSTRALPKITNSFSNLNLDVWQDLPSARGGIDSPRLQSQRSLQVVTPESAERPKFARKRVAWT